MHRQLCPRYAKEHNLNNEEMWVKIMGKALMWLQNVNMNFQLKHLMREQVCVHNIVTCECFCWKNTSGGPWVQSLSSASQ